MEHELASVDCVDRWSCDFECGGFYSALAESILEYSRRLLQVNSSVMTNESRFARKCVFLYKMRAN